MQFSLTALTDNNWQQLSTQTLILPLAKDAITNSLFQQINQYTHGFMGDCLEQNIDYWAEKKPLLLPVPASNLQRILLCQIPSQLDNKALETLAQTISAHCQTYRLSKVSIYLDTWCNDVNSKTSTIERLVTACVNASYRYPYAPQSDNEPAPTEASMTLLSQQCTGDDKQAVLDGKAIGLRGVKNVLAHAGVIEAAEPTGPTTYLDAVNGGAQVLAPFEGVFEAAFDVGDEVSEGQSAGWLYSLDEIERPPRELTFPRDGVVAVKAVTTRVVHGSMVARTATVVDRDTVAGLS